MPRRKPFPQLTFDAGSSTRSNDGPADRMRTPSGWSVYHQDGSDIAHEADDAFRLLERLNQPVQQDAIKAPVLPSNTVPVMFVERVHERPPADPSPAG